MLSQLTYQYTIRVVHTRSDCPEAHLLHLLVRSTHCSPSLFNTYLPPRSLIPLLSVESRLFLIFPPTPPPTPPVSTPRHNPLFFFTATMSDHNTHPTCDSTSSQPSASPPPVSSSSQPLSLSHPPCSSPQQCTNTEAHPSAEHIIEALQSVYHQSSNSFDGAAVRIFFFFFVVVMHTFF